MTHGMIASMLLSDLIEGKPNAWAELYDPARVTLRAAGEYLSENLNTLGQYLEWLRPPRAEENRIPEPGHGSIVCKGLRPLAVYREPGGALHVCSAVCSHLGGLVSWNSAAESWDCPCHGSRFAPDGSVLTGPANRPLDRLPVETLGAPEVTVRPGAGASVVASGGGSAAGA
jgi:Rieske Fe-S protein